MIASFIHFNLIKKPRVFSLKPPFMAHLSGLLLASNLSKGEKAELQKLSNKILILKTLPKEKISAYYKILDEADLCNLTYRHLFVPHFRQNDPARLKKTNPPILCINPQL